MKRLPIPLFSLFLWIVPIEVFGITNKKIVSLLLQKPDKEIDVLSCNFDWEDQIDYATILKVDSLFVMYYRTVMRHSKPYTAYCYATSNDGIHWQKPSLGLFAFNGSNNNNIITDRVDGVSVEYVNGEYWLLADRFYDETNSLKRGLILYRGTDGIHFERYDQFDIPFFCDSQNEIMWDATSKTFKLYLRSWYKSSNPNIDYHHTHQYYRAVSLLETPSLNCKLVPDAKPLRLAGKNNPPSISKELPMVIKNESSSEDFDIYCSYVHKYRRNLYIAYPINYYHTNDKKRGGEVDNDGYGTIGFWISKDGRTFREIKRDYITDGLNWMEFCIGHIETKDMFIHYYIRYDNSHGKKKNRNTIRARVHYKNRSKRA